MAAKKLFPEWAPPALVELHRAISEGRGSVPAMLIEAPGRPYLPLSRGIEILESLLTHAGMGNAWPKLRARAIGLEDWEYRVWMECLTAEARYAAAPKITTSAKRKALLGGKKKGKKIRGIADRARELGAAISDSPYFRDYRIADLLDERVFDRMADHLFEDLDHATDRSHEVRIGVLAQFPRPTELLESLALLAERLAQQPSDTPKPGAENAAATFFMRHLRRRFQRDFGDPMDDCIADLTSAVMGVDVGADTVSKAASRMRGPVLDRAPKKASRGRSSEG